VVAPEMVISQRELHNLGNEEIWRFRETELGMTLSEIGRLQVSEPEPDTTNEL